MKVLLVIHGYPRRYNAGSEVYTQTLAHALADAGCEVAVFTREENAFLPDYHLHTETDPLRADIPLHLVNHARANARFQNHHLDAVFAQVLDAVAPQVVHFGHLNHLSVGLPAVAKSRRVATLFTLHDFWLMCPRGQFLQHGLSSGEPWQLCNGQENRKCAVHCYNRFIPGVNPASETDYWQRWIGERMAQVRRACACVDLFIAPSQHLLRRHVDEFWLPAEKVVFLDYGFAAERYPRRARRTEEDFVFGYIGRHDPSKGIHLLIAAFSTLADNDDSRAAHDSHNARLRIWGRAAGGLTAALQRQAETHSRAASRIEWRTEYRNENIVQEVFNHCDCIVVPSIWDENSPLVIHEAQQCGVPVITAQHGGMGEYVNHGENGLTFKHRDAPSLRQAMRRAVAEPAALQRMGQRGYLGSADGKPISAKQHARQILGHYLRLTHSQSATRNAPTKQLRKPADEATP